MPASNMIIVAHQDDDILFMEQDLTAAIGRGEAMTTVFLTAGDAGRNAAYWQGREDGARAAYAVMAGSDAWVNETVRLTADGKRFDVQTSYLADQPEVRLYFMRVPDGMGNGAGSQRYGRESLVQLENGTLSEAHSVDGAATYSRNDLTGLLTEMMVRHEVSNIMVQDHSSIFTRTDHSDHIAGSILATEAHLAYGGDHTFEQYVDYGSHELPANVPPELLAHFQDIFLAYAAHDPAVNSGTNPDGSTYIAGSYANWLQRDYHVSDVLDVWSLDFVSDTGWRVATHVRAMADINGDGRADIVGFGSARVLTATAGDYFFGATQDWSSEFTSNAGWRTDATVRTMADMNGDGRDDIVAFGANGVTVALSDGTRFGAGTQWSADLGSATWSISRHEREMGDVNGDGRADVVGFGNGHVFVSLSSGTDLARVQSWTTDFTRQAGWRTDRHERVLGDVDGDGRDDIVGFGQNGVYVGLSTGTGFSDAAYWSHRFDRQDGWSIDLHQRMVADVNGDGRDDLVGFGDSGVVVALSNGHGFGPARVWSDDFGIDDGWSNARNERLMADVNGDGRADIVGFGADYVQIALSTGRGFEAPHYADDFIY